ncbi:hypothetical protein DSN97_10790 [Deferribacteraceae bacterium V6Fe1]|nr:hypothetical protein DSN97_10790 [Deferribacteraceae bacterium V6Fe1]
MKNIGVFSKDNFLYKELEEFTSDGNIILEQIADEEEIQDITAYDVFIVLSDFNEKLVNVIKNYNGTVLDLTGVVKNYYNNTEDIVEPSVYLLEKYFGDSLDAIKGNIYYPTCIFGKAGIDDLVNQTKDIFTFGNTEPKILKSSIPFNAILGMGFGQNGLKEYISRFGDTIISNFDLRLLPFSTYMIIDIFKPFNVEIYSDYLEEEIALSGILHDRTHKIYLIDDDRVTIVADYLKLISEQILEKIKFNMGE